MTGWDRGLRAPSVKDIYANPDQWIADVPPRERVNMYFTMAECLEESGRKPVAQNTLQFDVDGIEVRFKGEELDRGHLLNYAHVICKAIGVDFKQTGILFTGNGLQLMVGIEMKIEHEDYFKDTKPHYNAVCDKVDLALEKAKLTGKADRSIWDAKRVMRYPQTLNRKSGRQERWGQLLQSTIEHIDFDIIRRSGLPDVGLKDQVSDSIVRDWPEPDTKTVLAECKFLNWAQTCPSKVSEPEWYAMLSVVSRLPEGRKLAHQFSKDHPDYTFTETEQKINQTLSGSTGPRTCDNINVVSGGKCVGCKHHKTSLATPLFIEGPEYIKTSKTGFHSIVRDEEGRPRVGKPQYEDLRRYFKKEHDYVSTADVGIIRAFNGKFFEEISMLQMEAYALTHFDPRANSTMRKEFTAQTRLKEVVPPDFFQTSVAGKMNFQNGVLDILSGTLYPHSKEHGFMSVLTCDFDAKATAPRFEKFMDEVLGGDKELINVVQEFLGYAFSGMECKHQKAMMFSGSGENGKSVLLEVMKELLGKGFSSLSVKSMANEQNRYLLEGKLINIAEENARDAFKDSELVKNFIRGGEITVKKVYLPPYEFKNRTKLLMAVNELPTTYDLTHGFFRSFIIIPFNQVFSHEKGNRDTDILNKLRQELPGIFNWIMEGYKRLIKNNRFTEPKASREILDEYKLEANAFDAWCAEEVEIVAEKRLTATRDAYIKFKEYCDIGNQYCINEKKFVGLLQKKVESAGFVMDKSRRQVGDKKVSLISNVKVHNVKEF